MLSVLPGTLVYLAYPFFYLSQPSRRSVPGDKHGVVKREWKGTFLDSHNTPEVKALATQIFVPSSDGRNHIWTYKLMTR